MQSQVRAQPGAVLRRLLSRGLILRANAHHDLLQLEDIPHGCQDHQGHQTGLHQGQGGGGGQRDGDSPRRGRHVILSGSNRVFHIYASGGIDNISGESRRQPYATTNERLFTQSEFCCVISAHKRDLRSEWKRGRGGDVIGGGGG